MLDPAPASIPLAPPPPLPDAPGSSSSSAQQAPPHPSPFYSSQPSFSTDDTAPLIPKQPVDNEKKKKEKKKKPPKVGPPPSEPEIQPRLAEPAELQPQFSTSDIPPRQQFNTDESDTAPLISRGSGDWAGAALETEEGGQAGAGGARKVRRQCLPSLIQCLGCCLSNTSVNPDEDPLYDEPPAWVHR